MQFLWKDVNINDIKGIYIISNIRINDKNSVSNLSQ